ncbi:hypothetical protein [Deinococcus aestuarii]|uniref:hypothetical protein n=1 Tax=Deinococcus aestuarii TaxID=2774531 RepID=UPI001C0E3676|nr:hypothetical protein [Deinococcus aestuarii]
MVSGFVLNAQSVAFAHALVAEGVGFQNDISALWLNHVSSCLKRPLVDYIDYLYFVPLIVYPLAIFQMLWNTWHEDRRLRRTLALVGGAQL